jgi:nucleoside-diphosphate kinase
MAIEKTLAIIKPDAVDNGWAGVMLTHIEYDLKILQLKVETLTEERAKTFYAEHDGRPYFEKLVRFMISGPSIAVALRGEDAVARWRTTMKEVLRPVFASKEFSERNCVHGSDSAEAADRELRFFFWDLGWPWKQSMEGWDG